MSRLNLKSAGVSAAVCVGMAALGALLAGRGFKGWFASLAAPRFQVPLWGFYIVGAVVYLLDGVILYRLIQFDQSSGGGAVALSALLVVMLLNEIWNYA